MHMENSEQVKMLDWQAWSEGLPCVTPGTQFACSNICCKVCFLGCLLWLCHLIRLVLQGSADWHEHHGDDFLPWSVPVTDPPLPPLPTFLSGCIYRKAALGGMSHPSGAVNEVQGERVSGVGLSFLKINLCQKRSTLTRLVEMENAGYKVGWDIWRILHDARMESTLSLNCCRPRP